MCESLLIGLKAYKYSKLNWRSIHKSRLARFLLLEFYDFTSLFSAGLKPQISGRSMNSLGIRLFC